MKAAIVVPPNLTGKTLKVVTRDFEGGSSGPYRPLRGKEYDDTTPTLSIAIDVLSALGGKYTQLSSIPNPPQYMPNPQDYVINAVRGMTENQRAYLKSLLGL